MQQAASRRRFYIFSRHTDTLHCHTVCTSIASLLVWCRIASCHDIAILSLCTRYSIVSYLALTEYFALEHAERERRKKRVSKRRKPLLLHTCGDSFTLCCTYKYVGLVPLLIVHFCITLYLVLLFVQVAVAVLNDNLRPDIPHWCPGEFASLIKVSPSLYTLLHI